MALGLLACRWRFAGLGLVGLLLLLVGLGPFSALPALLYRLRPTDPDTKCYRGKVKKTPLPKRTIVD